MFLSKTAKIRYTIIHVYNDSSREDNPKIVSQNITEEELEKDPLYEPHRYYYWHGDIQEDYQMPKGYECLCEECFGDFLNAGEIITTDDSTWDSEKMGWFMPI